MRHFALLYHDHPFPHWDFLLETGEMLSTWRLHQLPEMTCSKQTIPAERLPDHRSLYLNYEGPVSGNRGSVTQVDKGAFILLEQSESHWQLRLEGVRLRGFATIHLGAGEEVSDRLLWVPDEEVLTRDGC